MNKQAFLFPPRMRRKQSSLSRRGSILWVFVFIFLFSFLILPNFVQAVECLAMDSEGNCTKVAGFLDNLNTPNCVEFDQSGQCIKTQTCIADGACSLNDVALGFIELTKFLIGAIGALALLYFIWGGIKWLTSYGNQQKIQQGREIMLQTVIAIIIAFMSYILVSFFVNNLLQVKPEVQVNTNTTYPAEPGQNNTDNNNQPSAHCCFNNNPNNPECSLSTTGVCSNNWTDLGAGICQDYAVCSLPQIGCCIDLDDNCVPANSDDDCAWEFRATSCSNITTCNQ